MMKQLFLHKGKPTTIACPAPLLSEHNVLVQVHYSFVSSGTEIATIKNAEQSLVKKFVGNAVGLSSKLLGAYKEHGFSATAALIKEKMNSVMPIGYSCSGRVIAVGKKVQGLALGEYVACAGSNAAYHADIVSVPMHLTAPLKGAVHLKQASITTIGAIALQGIRRASIGLGENVVILGLGLLGQLSVQLAKSAGARVFGIDINASRVELAKTFHADAAYNSQDSNTVQEILFATGHHGADVTIITAASASGELIDLAMALTRRKGKVVIVGDVGLNFSRDDFYNKEIDLLISCSYGPGRYDARYEQENNDYPYGYVRWTEQRNLHLFAQLIEDGKINVAPFVQQEFAIDNAEQAYQQLRENKNIGMVLAYQAAQQPSELTNFIAQFSKKNETLVPYKAPKGGIKVGMVGVGGFSKTKLLPCIAGISNVKISALIDMQAATLVNLGQLYNTKTISNDYRSLLSEEDINAVVIATPHKFHGEQALAFLQHGKAVFLEKPAAITRLELDALKQHIAFGKRSLFCVDFNRPFSPFMQQIKKNIIDRSGPCIMHYRMNAGYIPADHWTQHEEHGGRLIGEACHIFDLFCFLTDAQPTSVSVAPLVGQRGDLQKTDNVCVTLTMSDGSVCSLLYTAVGNANAGKESLELHVDGKTIIMDDYKDLQLHGFKKSDSICGAKPDKGHENLLARFFKAAHEDGVSPVPFSRIYHATLTSIIADELARVGGGYQLYEGMVNVEIEGPHHRPT